MSFSIVSFFAVAFGIRNAYSLRYHTREDLSRLSIPERRETHILGYSAT